MSGGDTRPATAWFDMIYERAGGDLCDPGLYLDVGPWTHHVFTVTAA